MNKQTTRPVSTRDQKGIEARDAAIGYLRENGHIDDRQVQQINARIKATDSSLMSTITELSIMDEKTTVATLAKFYGVKPANLDEKDIPEAIIKLISSQIALKHKIIPIDRAGQNLIVAISDPADVPAIDALRYTAGFTPKVLLASENEISKALKLYYGNPGEKANSNKKASLSDIAERLDVTRKEPGESPIVLMANKMLYECYKRGASDIHLEPYETSFRVRMRIDGTLVIVATPPMGMKLALISRLKIMAKMDIAETRLPQDGTIMIRVGRNPIDFRVNTLPTLGGEKMVLRILDKSNLNVDLAALGFEPDQMLAFKEAIFSPMGMVLVTGPTGSGKTTTLYSALEEINSPGTNIMTAEDPIEYSVEGINQTKIRGGIGLDFATVLKSFLRQDPDIIMVGEIRDLETVKIAVKAALTGHLVISTLHTNSAFDSITRLLNMGIEGYNLAAALKCVTAQRLAKKICADCKVEDTSVTPLALVDMGIHPNYLSRVKPMIGGGCETCQGLGYKGRVAIHEVMPILPTINAAILENKSATDIKRISLQSRVKSMRISALTKFFRGEISAAEVIRVTSSDWDVQDRDVFLDAYNKLYPGQAS